MSFERPSTVPQEKSQSESHEFRIDFTPEVFFNKGIQDARENSLEEAGVKKHEPLTTEKLPTYIESF